VIYLIEIRKKGGAVQKERAAPFAFKEDVIQ
jgi:hypothetical protein